MENPNLTAEITSEAEDNLRSLKLSSEYRTGQTDMVNDFYLPCFRRSVRYDRAVGFFRSTVFLLINHEIPNFVKRGGKFRIVCSPSLTESDLNALKDGYKNKEKIITDAVERELDELLLKIDVAERTIALATLIKHGVVDVKIAYRPDSFGMYHEKLGIFYDAGRNSVSFKGSSNETWNGWHESGNYESIEVFSSWDNSGDSSRVKKHADYFEKLWKGDAVGVTTCSVPRAIEEKLYRIAKDDIEKIEWKKFQSSKGAQAKRAPLDHQLLAIQNWKRAGCRGILEHATGSGKTFTAITAFSEEVQIGNPIMVLVPSKLLLRQWEKEIKAEIPEAVILKAGDGNIKWKREGLLKDFSSNEKLSKPRIVLSTMQTASSDEFLKGLSQGNHLMLVADEVHESGSPKHSRIYQINAGKRLGLSATPIRYGDPDGTNKMLSYFGGVVEPKFTLADAIKSGRLVPYEYFPHAVNLTAEEADKWKVLSDKISVESARANSDKNGNRELSDKVKMLLIQRARIAKKAQAKINLAEKIMSENYEDGQKWLVYCEDQDQLGEVLVRLRNAGLHVNEYHTSMTSDMDATLEWYKRHGGILVSIRCLDQGVDIPDISHALVLASSQNPRQFIQRRGRVLRKAPGKYMAVLHDAIVIPVDAENESEQNALLRSELARSIEFSKGAINKSSGVHLEKIALDMGFDVTQLLNDGSEEEIEEEQ